MIEYSQDYINDDLLPVVWKITKGSDADVNTVCEWVESEKLAINHILDTEGALLIRGLNHISSAADFNQVINTISPKLMDYIGGTSPRTAVHDKVMTATEIPAKWSIPLHQEMSYTSHPPDRIAFFCEHPAAQGGYSTLGNMRKVTASINPTMIKKFHLHGLQLRRALPSVTTLNHKAGLKKSWNEVFNTHDKNVVDDISSKMGWRAEWLDDDNLQLWQEILPAFTEHPVIKEKIWFNQVHMFTPYSALLWAKRDNREDDYTKIHNLHMSTPELLDTVVYGNGDAIDKSEIEYITHLLSNAEINVKLLKSDLLILDNILVAHGRTKFDGKRQIYVALMNK